MERWLNSGRVGDVIFEVGRVLVGWVVQWGFLAADGNHKRTLG